MQRGSDEVSHIEVLGLLIERIVLSTALIVLSVTRRDSDAVEFVRKAVMKSLKEYVRWSQSLNVRLENGRIPVSTDCGRMDVLTILPPWTSVLRYEQCLNRTIVLAKSSTVIRGFLFNVTASDSTSCSSARENLCDGM